jgi:iron complex outermembrane receptor protein
MSVKLRTAVRDAISGTTIASASALVLAAAAPGTAFAQDDVIEEITVKGIRGSLRQNIEIKRNNNSIVDAITAEDIGKFPDKNVAESLQRVPGVTVQRQWGEGAAVSIRGAGNELTLTTLNGQNVASTGWFVLEPARRSYNYELLPSELVGDIEVYKSSQADLAEGGVGGTVVINTRKPLDLPSLTVHGSAEIQTQSDSDEEDPQFSGMLSWKNDAENFGVLVSAVAQQRHLQRQGNEAFWEWGAGPVAFTQDRKRTALTATLQFAPNDNFEVLVNAMDMEMEADNTNYALWLTQGNTTWSGVPVTPDQVQNGATVAGPLNTSFYQARPREATMNSDVYDIRLNYYGDGFEANFVAGTTSSTGGTDFEMVVDDGVNTPLPDGATYDFRNGGQTWNTPGFDMAAYDPGSISMGTGSAFNRTPKTDDEDYLQADFTWDIDMGVFTTIKAGIRYAEHNTTSRQFFFEQDPNFVTSMSTSGINTGTIDVGSGDHQIMRLDSGALKAWAKSSITGEAEDLGSYSEIDEENLSLYVMAEFEGDGFRGNLGVRNASTDAKSTYYLDDSLDSTSADYSEFLPSLNVVFDVTDDILVRTSAARVMARPQYVDMYVNPNVVGTNDDVPNNQFWIVGNVGLKPFVANQFDIAVEWYFAEGSMVSAGYFTKDVKNFVNIAESRATADEIPFPLSNDPVAERDFGWFVQEKGNGKSAQIDGIELQYQQEFGNGFGGIVNYTYTDTDTDADTFTDGNPFLSDSSQDSYNITGYYENEMFQARLAYSHRSEYMIRESGSYGNRLHDDYNSLDFAGTYFINDNFAITLDINNILEEESKQFGNNQGASNTQFTLGFPAFEFETARRISLGVAFKF